MAASIPNMFVFVISITILGYFQCCVAQTTSENINANADISNCSCDLTVNACDVNCCCDWECDAEDKQVFSTCVDEYTPSDTRVCVRKEIIILNNTDLEVEETVDGLFCIYRDNYEERNFYEVPETVITEADFERYRGSDVYSYRQEVNNPSVGDFYQEGDAVYTIYQSGTLGLLGQPAPLTDDNCQDTNPAGYLRSRQLECTRSLVSLEHDCNTSLSLDVATYYQGFKVIKTPAAFADFPQIPDPAPTASMTTANTTSVVTTPVVTTGQTPTSDSATTVDVTEITVVLPVVRKCVINKRPVNQPKITVSTTVEAPVTGPPDPLYNSSYALDIVPTVEHVCIDQDGLNISCPFNGTDLPQPMYSPDTGVCSNTVVKVDYTITQSGTSGITSVDVQFTLKDLLPDHLPLTQAFNTNFPKVGETDPRPVSGKPGYVVGKPVRAGTITENSNKLAVNEIRDQDAGITIVTSAANGLCSGSDSGETTGRVPLTFGESLRSGCFLSASYDDLASMCTLLQELALNALKGPNLPTHVATFGNSSTEVTGDWVEILAPGDPSNPGTSEATCVNMVTGMHWEIMYSYVGAIDNPQAKVIGVSYNYTQQDVRYQCYGQYCQPSTGTFTQKFEVVSSVQYIDASTLAVGETAERPTISARLPDDFFYPFS